MSNSKHTWEERQLVYGQVERMGSLRYAAGAIVDFVYSLAPDACLINSSGQEWLIPPKPSWIALRFVYVRKKHLEVSLAIWPGLLDPANGPSITDGRYAGWSRVSIRAIEDLMPVMNHIAAAHRMSAPRPRAATKGAAIRSG